MAALGRIGERRVRNQVTARRVDLRRPKLKHVSDGTPVRIPEALLEPWPGRRGFSGGLEIQVGFVEIPGKLVRFPVQKASGPVHVGPGSKRDKLTGLEICPTGMFRQARAVPRRDEDRGLEPSMALRLFLQRRNELFVVTVLRCCGRFPV